MHILVHVLPNTRFIDSEHFVNTIDTCTTENFNCVFRETIKVEVIWFLHGILQFNMSYQNAKYTTANFSSQCDKTNVVC